ncbi:hypothetical protein FHY55_18360 [Oceanicola sp. D3]|uniref:hypothetical protein n=1 Tax=Oceanicola sp. D3 TaxID=2587163 RepID=UPI00111CDBEB|nr:hypothetical protein [Oceanicola sp. D3]QDC11075.1 hypothetical protein FHY55_18360 [Oceanicola sp. D3]
MHRLFAALACALLTLPVAAQDRAALEADCDSNGNYQACREALMSQDLPAGEAQKRAMIQLSALGRCHDAQAPHGESCWYVGYTLAYDDVLPTDPERGFFYANRACDMDSVKGCVALIAMHANGIGTEKSEDATRVAATRACDLGHADACAFIGR